MKKALFTAFVALMTVFCVSCNKEKELAGTTWQYHQSITEEMEIEGMVIPLTEDLTVSLKFTDGTNGTMDVDMVMTVMGQNQSINDSEPFTYTFDGTNGVLTATDGTTEDFTYNEEDNTITINEMVEDETTGQTTPMTLVFTEVITEVK